MEVIAVVAGAVLSIWFLRRGICLFDRLPEGAATAITVCAAV